MPDSPVSAKWLSEREKTIAVKRLVDDQLGVKNSMNSSNFSNSDTMLTKYPQLTLSGHKQENVRPTGDSG